MTSQSKKTSFDKISSLFEEPNMLMARVAIFSFIDFYPSKIYELLLLSFEYLQLILPILLFSLSFQNQQETTSTKMIYNTITLLEPSHWIVFEQIDTPAIIILSIITVLIICKLGLFGYIHYISFHKLQGNQLLINIWRHVFKLQGRFTYYFLTSFWIKILNIEKGDSNRALVIFGAFLIIIELLFSLFLNLKYYFILPTKSLLASKSNITETITLVQKFLLQIAITYFSKDTLTGFWIFAIINILIDIARNLYFFRTLPIYKLQTLKYQASILMVTTSLNLSVIILAIRKFQDSASILNNVKLVIILWAIISILAVKISCGFIEKTFWNLIINPEVKAPGLLVHRICAIKELQKRLRFLSKSSKTTWSLLASQTLTLNLQKIMRITSTVPLDIHSKTSTNQVLKQYLDKLQIQHPKDHFIQIFKAQFYAKTLNIYGEAIQISQKIQQEGHFSTHSLTASILLLTIQKIIKTDYQDNRKLNLWSYFYGKFFTEQIKIQMTQQANLQISICHEVKQDKPNLCQIFDKAQKFRVLQNKITKADFQNLPDSYLEPLLLYAGYHLLLNHSIQDYIYYRKIYTKRLRIYQKSFDQDNLLQENLHQENVGYFLVSVNNANPGAVVYGSKVLENYFGGDSSQYSGRHIYTFGPPCLEGVYKQAFLTREEKGATSMIGTINRNFVMRVEGYIQEVDSYLDVFPSVTQGCYWAVLIRPAVKANKDCIYILENGDIDSGTKGTTWNLNLSPTKYNVRDISEELVRVNEAFNMIAFPERYNQPEEKEGKFRLRRSIDRGRVTMEQAKEIYDLYTTTGKDLILSSIHEEKQYFSYNCKITNINFGSFLLKMATLEKNKTLITQQKLSEQEIIQLTSLQRIPLPKQHSANELSQSSSEGLSSELFETEEEKAPHWIDFKAIHSQNVSPRTENIYSTTDNGHRETTRQLLETIASPRGQHSLPKLIFTKEAPLPLQRKKPIVIINEDELSNSANDVNTDGFHKNLNDQNLFGEEVKSQISTVNGSKLSQQKRISRVYRNALDEIYQTRSTKLLLFISFIMLLILSIGQIGLKTRMDSDMLALRNKKDLVGGAELQNCEALSIQGVIRIIWDLRTGFLNSTSFSNYHASVPPFPVFVNTDLNKFALLNDYLLSNTSLLAQKYQDILFKKDVKMYYNYFDDPVENFATTDIFQASNMVLQISMKLRTEGAGSPQAAEHAKFLFRNSLNDLYMKNKIISNLMRESLNQQNQTIEKEILQNLIVLLTLLIVFFAYVIVLIIRQYQKQIIRLSAFCRIPNNKLDRVLHNFHDFKHILASDSPIQTSFFKKRLVSSKSLIMPVREDSKKELSKSPIYSQQRRKIYIPIICLTVLCLSFVVVTICASVLYLNFLTSLQGKQDLIYFADAIAAKLTLGWSTARELLVTNNTALVEKKNVGEKLEEILSDISNIRAKGYDVLLQDNHEVSYNEIKGLIIGDACNLLASNYVGFCKFLKSLGQTPNLIENLNNFESLLRARLEKYESSDKSLEAIKAIEIEDFYLVHNNFVLLRAVSGQISALLNENYEEEILKTKGQGNIILGLFIFCGVLASVCFWKYVYVRLRDEVSQFKNILRVLPGDVVLSNFILKAFLMKTSNRILETIKNDI